MEFSIDLLPEIAPISRALYRMTSAELQELNTQLNEMLDKWFYKTNASITFMDLINKVFHKYVDEFVIIFV